MTPDSPSENDAARRLNAAQWRRIIQEVPLYFEVISWSMMPTFCKGEHVLIRPLEAGEPRPGQVLAYFRGMPVTHRYLGDGVCRGDNLLEYDPPITTEDMLGIVVEVKRGGVIVPIGGAMPWKTRLRRIRLHLRWLGRRMINFGKGSS